MMKFLAKSCLPLWICFTLSFQAQAQASIVPSNNGILYVNQNVSGGDQSGDSWGRRHSRAGRCHQMVDSRLEIVSNVGGIDVNFINITGVEGSSLYKIYVKKEGDEPIFCATCYNNAVGLHALPTANNVALKGKNRTSKKSEVPQGYSLEKLSKSGIGRGAIAKFYKKLEEGGIPVGLPAVTSLFTYEDNKGVPTCLVNKVYVKTAEEGTFVCDLEFDQVALLFRMDAFRLNTRYHVIAQRADKTDVNLAVFSLMKNDNNKAIFATFSYLEAGVS